ncbi:T9SS type A sorting domain-containing protein [Flavobacterium sp. N3904]|uniref:T9SS type A sorting domain-containing protein n=1 Tax=Flavobacterium sp. N3904 TaxID=2986835 RepID=UPI00222488D1|nr:T9SS type A sorting domain-containing protein [Flavobacterium sp. N3904]
MKHPNLKFINLLIIMMLFFSFKGISQITQGNSNNIMGNINASGSNASGSSGTVAYSIGQVFYTYIGESVYSVAQGVQQEENSETLETPENVKPKIEIAVFPNPTTDYINIVMEGFESEKGPRSYQLYDYLGRLLKQNTINETETQVNLSNLSSSIYILRVYVNNAVLKTIKILKK